MLTDFETWGGEPFLHMDRFYPVLKQLIEYYPYLKSGFSSTNFSYDTWIEQFFGLMDCFALYSYRNFDYHLQLSVDGPEYLNDSNRGIGTTKKCLANFNKLVELLKNNRLSDNITLNITIKGTLDNEDIKLLNDKEKIIEYYQFLEDNFIDPISKLNKNNINIFYNVPNTAVPSPVTVEDGRIFASFVKKCKEIEKENKSPFVLVSTYNDEDVIIDGNHVAAAYKELSEEGKNYLVPILYVKKEEIERFEKEHKDYHYKEKTYTKTKLIDE